MKSRELDTTDGLRTFVLIFETGDEVVRPLTEFAAGHHLGGGHFTAIGAFERAVLGYFDWQRKDYDRIPVEEQVEVLSLSGDVALEGANARVHAHVVLGKRDGAAIGGHLIEATVRPTLELVLTELPRRLERRSDPETGLALIRV